MKANKYKGTAIITQNSKLKKTSKKNNLTIFNFGIPAYKTQSGKFTCPFADVCVDFCYAQDGAYAWSNVKPAFEKRYELSKLPEFQSTLIGALEGKKVQVLRIHDSGDFYSPKYLQKWIDIANQLPNVIFYFYTKSVKMVQAVALPENMKSIFSFGGKQDNLINKETDRHAVIFDDLESLLAAGYVNASEDDLKAISDNKKVGLIIH